jgi:hypothetical protein
MSAAIFILKIKFTLFENQIRKTVEAKVIVVVFFYQKWAAWCP